MSEQPTFTPKVLPALNGTPRQTYSELPTLLRPKTVSSAREPVTPRRQAWLVVIQAKRAQPGMLIALDTSLGYRFRMGTNQETCDIVFVDEQKKLSREHAELEFDAQEGCFRLRDLRSTNETFVRPPKQSGFTAVAPSEPVTLVDGTYIRLGPEGTLALFFRQTE